VFQKNPGSGYLTAIRKNEKQTFLDEIRDFGYPDEAPS